MTTQPLRHFTPLWIQHIAIRTRRDADITATLDLSTRPQRPFRCGMCLPEISFPFYLGGELEECQRPFFHFAFIHRAVQPSLAVMIFVCGKQKQNGVDITQKIYMCVCCVLRLSYSLPCPRI